MIIDTNEILKKIFTNRYQTIRTLFITGFILNIILTFIPSASYQPYSYYEQPLKYLSAYDGIQILFKAQSFWGFYFVFLFSLNIVFIVLAIKYPKGWIFIAGASVTGFNYVLSLFMPSNPDIHSVFVTAVFQYLASLFILSGFFANPSKEKPNTTD